MSANRKLQTEIQQVLKKIEEGVEEFDEIWEKVYAAEQQSLKEKYEADLKKEIKKLQRLRDQVKTWLGSSEIKDKAPLQEARKVIETKMEQFKICEKDTKTKAYSKEGLARDSRNDPKDIEREEKRNWANECLEKLNDIIDSIEADIEKISSGKVKSKNKEQLEKLENRIKKNRWHIARLEQIIKLLDNEELDPSRLDAVKDDVEYYIETAKEDDGALGVDDEFDIYEELELDAVSLAISDKDAEPSDDTDSTSTPASVVESTKAVEPETLILKKVAVPVPVPIKPVVTNRVSTSTGITSLAKPNVKVNSNLNSPNITATATTPLKVPSSPLISPNLPPVKLKEKLGTPKLEPSPKLSVQETIDDAPIKTESVGSWASLASSQKTNTPKTAINNDIDIKQQSIDEPIVTETKEIEPNSEIIPDESEKIPDSLTLDDNLSLAMNSSAYQLNDKIDDSLIDPLSSNSIYSKPIDSINSRPISLDYSVPVPSHMLKCSMLCTPEPYESDKQTSYFPKNPYPTQHPSFPTQPLPIFENPAFFDKVPVDTLLFAFYYQQGTYQQYLAAKKLKLNSW
eukprot:CAMPEP_0196764318 /NCGR_PEP_ID=MMETSP1095-20130614/5879_1 /TAXON_ID=96789 ORGANISM="Chromulina nebulosa, Strain UTEXLB2642" /NCGR_SAMPLE_ID=MMETSP1095 /ASSEMBLY_ACC=CAM_ASM_000446 /LENGTH=570 /DNA_ID=CAMNT_0042119595 /DNA_START=41 /DNA_END=1750 /DNA_ORIENTATION=-